jgi:hypothetical protein
MILEASRIVSTWLGHGTYGVAALLSSTIPREAGDALPTIATITDEYGTTLAAGGRLPGTLPALSVDTFAADVVENQVVADQGDGTVVVRVRYGASLADLAQAKRNGSYVIRAVAASLRILNRNANVASRTRNSLQLRPAKGGAVEVRPYFEQLEDRVVTALCVATYDFRDVLTLP